MREKGGRYEWNCFTKQHEKFVISKLTTSKYQDEISPFRSTNLKLTY